MERAQAFNVIIGYIDDKSIAIVKNEWGNLFYIKIPREFISIGDVVSTEDISPISDLPGDVQAEICEIAKEF